MNTLFQILTLSWSLQGGVLPQTALSPSIEDVYTSGPQLFVEYGFELSYPIFSGNKSDQNGIYTGTTLRNQFVKSGSGAEFAPIQDTYTFSAGVRWNELTVGFDHVCTHSVGNNVQNQLVSQTLFGSMDQIFVKLDGKL